MKNNAKITSFKGHTCKLAGINVECDMHSDAQNLFTRVFILDTIRATLIYLMHTLYMYLDKTYDIVKIILRRYI